MTNRSVPRTAVWILPLLIIVIGFGWMYTKMGCHDQVVNTGKTFDRNGLFKISVENRSDVVESKKEAAIDIWSYKEPPVAGGGSFLEELQRFIIFVTRQGVVCQNLKHFGGVYLQNKKPPDYDPDGSWSVCLDAATGLTKGSCIVYSIGINNEWSFDDGIGEYGCQVYAFDPSMNQQSHQRSQSVQFFNYGLSDKDSEGTPGGPGRASWKTRTLKTIIKELNHEDKQIDLLKMDIEWDEWKCLPQMMADGTLRKYVKQLDIEYHVANPNPQGIRHYYGVVQWLDRSTYRGFKGLIEGVPNNL